jgi:hypothetical protein
VISLEELANLLKRRATKMPGAFLVDQFPIGDLLVGVESAVQPLVRGCI